MDALLRFIRVQGFRRGRTGSSAWFVVGTAAWMIARARRRDDVVYRTELKPGETLVVAASPPGKRGPRRGR